MIFSYPLFVLEFLDEGITYYDKHHQPIPGHITPEEAKANLMKAQALRYAKEFFLKKYNEEFVQGLVKGLERLGDLDDQRNQKNESDQT